MHLKWRYCMFQDRLVLNVTYRYRPDLPNKKQFWRWWISNRPSFSVYFINNSLFHRKMRISQLKKTMKNHCYFLNHAIFRYPKLLILKWTAEIAFIFDMLFSRHITNHQKRNLGSSWNVASRLHLVANIPVYLRRSSFS